MQYIFLYLGIKIYSECQCGGGSLFVKDLPLVHKSSFKVRLPYDYSAPAAFFAWTWGGF
jgi:hypothetical protein